MVCVASASVAARCAGSARCGPSNPSLRGGSVARSTSAPRLSSVARGRDRSPIPVPPSSRTRGAAGPCRPSRAQSSRPRRRACSRKGAARTTRRGENTPPDRTVGRTFASAAEPRCHQAVARQRGHARCMDTRAWFAGRKQVALGEVHDRTLRHRLALPRSSPMARRSPNEHVTASPTGLPHRDVPDLAVDDVLNHRPEFLVRLGQLERPGVLLDLLV